jgi:hypothetical protein
LAHVVHIERKNINMLVQQLSQLALPVLGKMITERPGERLFLTGI